MDYRHIVFPELSSDLYRSRQQRVAHTLDQIQTALAKERRDLQRDAEGCPPIEGVGVEVADIPLPLTDPSIDPVSSSASAG